jgi:MYXO-CTERM domain-containing protein
LSACALLLCGVAQAGTLSGAQVPAVAGSQVAVEFTLSADASERVTGIQFDLQFDSRALSITKIDTGPAALAAGKILSSNELAPGRYRVLVAGLNQSQIESGVVVVAEVEVAPDAGGTLPLEIAALVLSDPKGRSIAAGSKDAALLLGNPAKAAETPPARGCGCSSGAPPAQTGGGTVPLLAALAVAGAWRERRR